MVWVCLMTLFLSGCTFHLSILSNNTILSTRSQSTGLGDADGLVEGGATIDAKATMVP